MKKIILIAVLLTLIVPSSALAEQKAVLYFSQAGTNYSVGQSFSVIVMADPKGEVIDTVKAVINFSKDNLEVKSIVLNQVFSVADPESFYNNLQGVISYAAGTPGSTLQLSQFATITFRAKKAGQASISFDNQSVVLNGGVNVLDGFGQPLSINISEVASAPVVNPAPSEIMPTQNKVSKSAENSDSQKEAIGAAALEEAVIPIVERVEANNFWNLLQSKKWPLLLAVILFGILAFKFRKSIYLFLSKKLNKNSPV